MTADHALARVPRRALAIVAAGLVTALAACQTPPPPPPSVATLLEQPAERALAAGLVDYDDGAFDRAQASFESAVRQRLRDPHDAAVAHKHLAFIACAFNRPADCETQFRAAFASDPAFRLTTRNRPPHLGTGIPARCRGTRRTAKSAVARPCRGATGAAAVRRLPRDRARGHGC